MILATLCVLVFISFTTRAYRLKFGLYLVGLLVMSCYVVSIHNGKITVHWVPALIDALVLIGLGAWVRDYILDETVARTKDKEAWHKAYKAVIDSLPERDSYRPNDHSTKHTDPMP